MKKFSIKRLTAVLLAISMIMTSLGLQDETAYAISKRVKSVSIKIGSRNVMKKTIKMTKGKSKQLRVIVKPKSAKKSVNYQSKNKKVVTVSKKGKLKARNIGTAKVIIRIKGKGGFSKKTWVRIKVSPKKTETEKDPNESTDHINDYMVSFYLNGGCCAVCYLRIAGKVFA